MQNRLNAIFKQIARNSEYSDRGNAVLQQNIKEIGFTSQTRKMTFILKFSECGIMMMNSV